MKDKLVGCLKCKSSHLLSKRVKPEHYSNGEWSSVCPKCGDDGFVSMKQFIKFCKVVN